MAFQFLRNLSAARHSDILYQPFESSVMDDNRIGNMFYRHYGCYFQYYAVPHYKYDTVKTQWQQLRNTIISLLAQASLDRHLLALPPGPARNVW